MGEVERERGLRERKVEKEAMGERGKEREDQAQRAGRGGVRKWKDGGAISKWFVKAERRKKNVNVNVDISQRENIRES